MVRVAVANDVASGSAGCAGAAGAISIAETALARLAARALVPAAGAVADADGAEQRGKHLQPGEVVARAWDAGGRGGAGSHALRDADHDLLAATAEKHA